MTGRLGRSDISYEALRLLTLQAPGGGGGGGGSNANLGNSIYVWHADGSAVDQFEPNAVGLLLAIATIRGNDTIWLPSVKITGLVANISLPNGATLIGINRNQSILEFAGFNGTALTLGVDSMADHFTLNMTSNGTTAIGINAQQSGSRVEHVISHASGGSSSNIDFLVGV